MHNQQEPGVILMRPGHMKNKRSFIILILLGGMLVLGSYGMVFQAGPDIISTMWGGVPERLMPFYQANMLWGMAGYFLYTLFFLFVMPEGATGFSARLENRLLLIFYALILFPSSMWTPLTLMMISHPTNLTWAAIRIVLVLVGAGSLGIFYLLLRARPKHFSLFYLFAIVGMRWFLPADRPSGCGHLADVL
jgi:hypothetical protein